MTRTTTTMRAAIFRSFGGPIEIEEVDRPIIDEEEEEEDANSVILQVMATGVCRSDWHAYKGHDSDVIEHGFPFCPGHEFSGIVVEKGRHVQKLRLGDRVAVPFIVSCGSCTYCHSGSSTVCLHQKQPGFTQWGSFAEYIKLPRADRNLRVLPSNVSFVQAAALGCRFTTAFRAVMQQGKFLEEMELLQSQQRNNTKIGNTKTKISVGIFGCGGLGLACIMMIVAAVQQQQKQQQEIQQQRGSICPSTLVQIIAVDVSSQALKKSQELGATHTVLASIDPNEQAQVRDQVKALTDDGHGLDLSIDAAGFSATCENAVHCTRPQGRMIQVGLPIDTHSRPPLVPMGIVAGKELQLVGSHGFASSDLPELLQWVSDGLVDPAQLVERHVSLEEGAQAIQDMDHGSPLGITVVTDFQKPSTNGPVTSKL
ncbi:alcohol dehydrogenase [Nitzschia inconspicua]|uniref:Alcohol dehydrogenase n=1 Tax=Nitzschia inconspicua TaxID=303405 RepID=A0A9K3LP78_9STRA|nr:alcohol dehydrogenase [Nitzschia inconspicua]